jgi:Nickel responsive protein SCO4226-like
MARQTYLIEHYRPGFSAEALEQWAERVRATAIEMAREGEPVRYLRWTIVPSDESLLCVLEASSDELVRAVYARAGLPFERLTVVISDDTPINAEGVEQ